MEDDIRPLHGVHTEVSGRHVFGGYLDERDKVIYFGRRGERIPVGSSTYRAGPIVALVVCAFWAATMRLIVSSADDRSLPVTITIIVLLVLLTVALTAPFLLRRRAGTEGRLHDALGRGDVIAVRVSQPLSRELLRFAESHVPGYFEQAIELARADALRLQSEQMRELQAAGSAAGPREAQLGADLAAYADRLDAAAAGREAMVRTYLQGGRRG